MSDSTVPATQAGWMASIPALSHQLIFEADRAASGTNCGLPLGFFETQGWSLRGVKSPQIREEIGKPGAQSLALDLGSILESVP